MLSPNGSTFCPNGHSESWRSWIPLLHTSPTTTSPTREKPLWKLSSFHLGLFATEPHYLIKKTICLQLALFPSSITGTSYLHGRMDGCILRTCMDMEDNAICTPGKKAKKENQKRKRKTREKIAARILHRCSPPLCIHSCIMCSFLLGLNSTGWYCSRVYSILVRNTEEAS